MAGKVLVAMSGGVDSSVASLLLKEQGLEVAGVTMCLGVQEISEGSVSCCGRQAIEDARRVCNRIGIPHHVLDLSKALDKFVVARFIKEYQRGRTPNPCVECNRVLKFRIILENALAMGFDYLATGHYARIVREGGQLHLVKPKDREKDQTYFLYPIRRESLERILFPLGSYSKDEVRSLAAEAELPVASKEESQEICFVREKDYGDFLAKRMKDIRTGAIVDEAGKKLGEHRGIPFYTVGQRRGLGISGSHPYYVKSIDAEKNLIVVTGSGGLSARGLVAAEVTMLAHRLPHRVLAKIRYRNRETGCTVTWRDHRLEVLFDREQRAVTPGQSVVFYDGDRVLGGGIIEKALYRE
jgi:tRNA-specific 2-thiouridylase